MKKIAIYSLLAVAGIALSACTEDFKDWAEPTSPADPGEVVVSFTPSGVNALDLRGMSADSVVAFNPNLAIAGATNVSTTFDVAIFNAAKNDSVVISGDEQGRVRRSDLQGAIIALYGNIEQARQAMMNITANSLVDGIMVHTRALDIPVTVTPQQQELPPVWYILGNCIGIGTFLNNTIVGGKFGAMYTSLVVMYPNPLNYDELIYPTYLCENGQFKCILKAGSRTDYINDGSGVYDNNVTVAEAGYYKIIVNTKDTTMRYEPLVVKNVVKYEGMTMSNGNAMKAITTNVNGENHDWLGDLVVDTDAPAGQGIKFVAADGTTWGSEEFPAGRAQLDAAGIPYQSGTYKVVFNDLMGLFRFIEQ